MSWKLAASSGKEAKSKLFVRTVEANEAAVVYCAGQICVRQEAARFGQAVNKFLSSRKNIVLELSAVEAIDSAGLGELVLLSMQARAAECEVRLAAPSEDLLNLLRLSNIASLSEIYSGVEQALASLRNQVIA
jgi:anti-sigma B factor antagonist